MPEYLKENFNDHDCLELFNQQCNIRKLQHPLLSDSIDGVILSFKKNKSSPTFDFRYELNRAFESLDRITLKNHGIEMFRDECLKAIDHDPSIESQVQSMFEDLVKHDPNPDLNSIYDARGSLKSIVNMAISPSF